MEAVRIDWGFHLRKTKYIKDLLDRVKQIETKPSLTPMIGGQSMSKVDGIPLKNPS